MSAARTLLYGYSALLQILFSMPVSAQDATPAARSYEVSDGLNEIVVTSTRIRNANFEAPTPVQEISIEMIDRRGTTNVADIINEMPAFTGTITPSSTTLNSRQNGINAVDLRGLGANRNLVLVNGRRAAPFDEFGDVDLNAAPALAINRVEVVTGGASAAWGSDAISGVVNLIYDEKLDRLKLNVQYGESGKSDAGNVRVSAAWGSKISDDRGHVLIAADYDDNKGVPLASARGWQRRSPGLMANPADTGPNDGIPQFIIRDNAVLFLASPNGITLPGAGATSNLEFFPDGTARPRALGENLGGVLMTGGSGSRLGDQGALVVPTKRFNLLAAAHLDVSNRLTLFGETSFAESKSRGVLVPPFTFGDVIIQPDNAYLPANIAALSEPFALFRTFEEISPIGSVSKNVSKRLVGGLKGAFAKSWTWEFSGQYAQTDFSNDQPNNLLPAKLALAADAVFDSSANQVVCRANLSGANGAPGCIPVNLFGKGSPNRAAFDYITGTGMSDTQIKQTVFAATLSGELLQGWAGPILSSFGVEHRHETLNREVNAPNANEEFIIVNAEPLNGDFNVTEGFAEVAIPIIGGKRSLDFDGAVRATHYSTVGNVMTWKTGLVFSPIESLRLRATISRDIRAPSIGETFVKSVLFFDNVSNPFVPGGGTELIRAPISGNPNLSEERALSKTIGALVSIGRFKASVDFYDIDLRDAIGTLASQDVVDRCFAGEQTLCSLITFGPNQSIVEVKSQNLNLGTFNVRGIDFDTRYSLPLDGGNLELGFLASHLIHKEIAPTGGASIDVAGELGKGSGFGTPDFKAIASVSYDTDRWGSFMQLRYVGSGVYDATYGFEELSASENHIAAIAYLDVSAKYKLGAKWDGDVEIYAGIDNVFDRDPPVIPDDFIVNSATNATHYDVIGRKFFLGLRAKF